MKEECLVAPPAVLEPVTKVRSTLLQSSLNSLRTHGHYERYLTLVDPTYREFILGSLAPEWLPLVVAEAHYAACDALHLTPELMQRIGEDVGDRIQGTFLGTVVKRARLLGLTPWLLLDQFERLWGRLMQGGGVAVYRTGPKDVRVEIYNLPLLRYAYFRTGMCGVIGAGIKLGAGRSVVVNVMSSGRAEERLLFNAAWV